MKLEQIKKLNTEDLEKKEKTHKMGSIVLFCLVLLMLFVSFFKWIESGFSALVIMPFFFIPLVLVNYRTYKMIQKELTSRNN